MKKCQTCNHENSEVMRFCIECGTSLADSPPMVVRLGESQTQDQSAPDTAFNKSAETVIGGSPFPTNFPITPPTRSKSNKKLFIILGGIVSLGLLLLIAGAAIVIYNLLPKGVVVSNSSPTPAPTRAIVEKSPSPSASPSVSPSATPQVSFTPPLEPTKKGTFTVYANSSWQLSEIDTVALEDFRTSVQGLVDLAGIKTGVSAKGVNDAKAKSRRIYPEYPTGALMMRTRYADGKYSNVQPVTASPSVGEWQNFPDERGRLEFCINDNAPAENGGQFTVTVTMISVPKSKK